MFQKKLSQSLNLNNKTIASLQPNVSPRRYNVQFQKISISTPWKVIGNYEGVGGLKSQNF